MHTRVRAILAAVALSVPAVSSAQLSVGLRAGYARPVGDLEKGLDQEDFITRQVPIQLDIDYRLLLGFTVGVYGSYGFAKAGQTGTGCDLAGIDCQTATIYRVGAQATFTLPFPLVKPWLGAGVGYEWAKVTREGARNIGARGPEKLNLQLGIDADLFHFRVGPFVTWTLGEYRRSSVLNDGDAVNIVNTANHSYVYYGLRIRFDP
jgi:hypothetical protein